VQMDIKAAIAEAERILGKVKEQEDKTVRALEGYGKEVLQKARQSFRTTISETEAELKKLRKKFK
jgi:vacuolar-type H+-ATPase subunit H